MGLSSIAHASDQITNYRLPYENKLYIGLAQTEVHFSLTQRCKGSTSIHSLIKDSDSLQLVIRLPRNVHCVRGR